MLKYVRTRLSRWFRGNMMLLDNSRAVFAPRGVNRWGCVKAFGSVNKGEGDKSVSGNEVVGKRNETKIETGNF